MNDAGTLSPVASDQEPAEAPATGEFRLSIMRALADQLADGLRALKPAPLDLEHLADVYSKPGVYQLYQNDVLVYVGKDESSVANRLREHYDKIKCRLKITPIEMSFTALYVHEDLHSVAPERRLIASYKEQGLAAWNGKGFGPHDPGKHRDETAFGPDHFDTMYPANLHWTCKEIAMGTYTATNLLQQVKKNVPFVFRYKKADFHRGIEVTVDWENPTADELFELLGQAINAVGPDWQIIALPGYAIMYDKRTQYPSARKRYPYTGSVA
ncbi:GIY-YIG nuclease family protein [Allokutzneria sp. NRRL B-24872]|uniref:GIY-YIG nuclease family protein n=1 Tax=Allokutzneria sp. NRRL B-24872 TaxID=1137961 RepID=UPI001177424D|nr:GIY-YIG nuclease family protein [Allokutzneria sp. NRRL B-24872]